MGNPCLGRWGVTSCLGREKFLLSYGEKEIHVYFGAAGV